jgi:hypothetical protein
MVLDLNVASQEELLDLPGIGQDRAQAILQARPFAAVDDLLSVPGIGPIILRRVKERGVVVSGRPSRPQASKAGPVDELPAGDQPMPGEEMAGVGDAAPMPGEEMAGMGDAAPMPGEEMASVGDAAPMPGERSIGAEEAQQIELTGRWRLTVALEPSDTSAQG